MTSSVFRLIYLTAVFVASFALLPHAAAAQGDADRSLEPRPAPGSPAGRILTGIKLGAAASTLTGKGSGLPIPSVVAAIYGSVPIIVERFVFVPEIRVLLKGESENSEAAPTHHYYYLEMPLMLALRAIGPVSITGGAVPALLLSGDGGAQRFDVGIAGGVDVAILRREPLRVTTELRLTVGLGTVQISSAHQGQFQVLSWTVGCAF